MLANLLTLSLPLFTLFLSLPQVSRWTSRWYWWTRGRSSSGVAPSRGCRSPTSSNRSPRSPSWSPRPTTAPGTGTLSLKKMCDAEFRAKTSSRGPVFRRFTQWHTDRQLLQRKANRQEELPGNGALPKIIHLQSSDFSSHWDTFIQWKCVFLCQTRHKLAQTVQLLFVMTQHC